MRAVFLDCSPALFAMIEEGGWELPDDLHVMLGDPSPVDIVEACLTADIVLVEHTNIPDEAISRSPSLRAVIFMGTGAGSYVNLSLAKASGIQVLTTPGYGDRAVAEHALALLFAGARDIARMDREVRSGEWTPRMGMQLAGRKTAVIGLGGIGTNFAGMASALGMDVMGWNRSPRPDPWFEPDLDRVLDGADCISVHLALNDQTKGLLGPRQLGLPNRGFLLVNTARAEIVDQVALLASLDSGHAGHAALDVFVDEPLPHGDSLRDRADVTLTAHAAYMTLDAYAELWRRTMQAFHGAFAAVNQRGTICRESRPSRQ